MGNNIKVKFLQVMKKTILRKEDLDFTGSA